MTRKLELSSRSNGPEAGKELFPSGLTHAENPIVLCSCFSDLVLVGPAVGWQTPASSPALRGQKGRRPHQLPAAVRWGLSPFHWVKMAFSQSADGLVTGRRQGSAINNTGHPSKSCPGLSHCPDTRHLSLTLGIFLVSPHKTSSM
jgi:hypothetical protein